VFLAASHLTWTYLKFGSPWNIVPVQMHIGYPPARLQAINGTLVHPEDLPFNVEQYFVLPNLRLRREFPWVYCQDPSGVVHDGVKLDVFEPYAGIPAFLVIAATVGLHEILSLAPGMLRRGAWGALGAAAVFSIAANLAFAFTYQKDLVWGVPDERRLELTRLERRIDAAFQVEPRERAGP
jgi:hypothetical protein